MRPVGAYYVFSLTLLPVVLLQVLLPKPAYSGDVLFNDVGLAAAQTSYGHITFALKRDDLYEKFVVRAWQVFTSFLNNTGLHSHARHCEHGHTHHHPQPAPVKCTSTVMLTNETISYVTTLLAELRDITVTIEQVTREMGTMTFGHHHHFSNRERRQFFELAIGVTEILNLGLTIRNAYELEEFRKKMATLTTRVESLITMNDEIMKTELRDHEMIVKIANQTTETSKAVAADRITTLYIGYKLVLVNIKDEAMATYSALALLPQGIVSPVLVNFTRLDMAFREFKTMAARRGLAPLFPSADTLLATHATYWIEDGGSTLRIALPIAISAINAKFLTAYRLESEPTTIPGPDGLQAVFVSPHRYILVNEDRSFYFALTEEEWSRCSRLAGKSICTEVRMRKNLFKSSCISALFLGLPERKEQCTIQIRKAPSFEVKEVSSGLLRIHSLSDVGVQWRTRCFGRPDTVGTTRNGTTYLPVPEGCTVFGPEGAYTRPPNTVEYSTNITLIDQHDLGLPPSLAAFANWSEVRTFLDEAAITDYVDATKLSEMKEEQLLRDIHRPLVSFDEFSLVDVVLLTLVTVVGLVVVFAISYYCIRRRRSRPSPVDMTREEVALSSFEVSSSATNTVCESTSEASTSQPRTRPQKKSKAAQKTDFIVVKQ